MNLMQLIKVVLDDAYVAIKAKNESARDELIKAEIGSLSSAYAKLTNRKSEPIDYSDPVKRFAYIFKYTVAHADYIMQLIRSEKELGTLVCRPATEVACLGGGPGSKHEGEVATVVTDILASELDGHHKVCTDPPQQEIRTLGLSQVLSSKQENRSSTLL